MRWPDVLDGLVPLSPAHAHAYAALLADERVHPWVIEGGPFPEARISERIAQKRADRARGGSATWAIVDGGGAFVGYVSLHRFVRPGWP